MNEKDGKKINILMIVLPSNEVKILNIKFFVVKILTCDFVELEEKTDLMNRESIYHAIQRIQN